MNTYGTQSHFNGRVGVIIEVAPNQFIQYVMKEVEADIEVNREDYAMEPEVPLSRFISGTTFARFHLAGRLVDQSEAQRPAWMPTQPAGELESARALEQR